jgi:hypothetical protein
MDVSTASVRLPRNNPNRAHRCRPNPPLVGAETLDCGGFGMFPQRVRSDDILHRRAVEKASLSKLWAIEFEVGW